MAAKRRKKAKKRAAKRRPAKRKAAKRKPARRKKAAKRKPARRKKATKRKKAKRKPARRKKAKRKPARRKKAAKRRPAKRKAAKKKRKKSKRKPNAAFMRPVSPDATLAAVVGAKPLPRTELTKKLWAYIRKHGLQDKRNRRMINADAALRRVFGGKAQVSMFEMTKLVSRHVR